MKRIASIELDLGEAGIGRRRGTIYLHRGRLICRGEDITPMPGQYERGITGYLRASRDIEAMYAGGAWGLRMAGED